MFETIEIHLIGQKGNLKKLLNSCIEERELRQHAFNSGEINKRTPIIYINKLK